MTGEPTATTDHSPSPARRSGGATRSWDIKRVHRALYAPSADDFSIVDVPEFSFLMVDGQGDPNRSDSYRAAVQALFTLSYAVRAVTREHLDVVHTVGPLEGLWSADDPQVFRSRDKSAWDWTMLIAQPDWVSDELVDAARAAVTRKTRGAKVMPALARARFERVREGRSVQILHVGSYDHEGPTLARLHDVFMPSHGLGFAGPHHEIYLSDPRRTAADRLKTILRQPVSGPLPTMER